MPDLARRLLDRLAERLAVGDGRVAVLGLSAEALVVAAEARKLLSDADCVKVFDPSGDAAGHAQVEPWDELAPYSPDLLVVAEDRLKESLLTAAAAVLDQQRPLPHVLLEGLGHQSPDTDKQFRELEAPALVPSYATGHPHTRVHLLECLRAAAYRGRNGAIVELGAFKGGTSVWLAKAARLLGLAESPVIAFDAWDGFPPRRSILDLYEHPRCVFSDLAAVRAYTAPYGIELVVGDIFETAPNRLADEPVLLAFVDTDNYSGARAALDAIVPNLVPGGAIVFDHFHTTEDYAYTIGERLAATASLADRGFLNLHGTGVFLDVSR
jgi:O-methyltransferase